MTRLDYDGDIVYVMVIRGTIQYHGGISHLVTSPEEWAASRRRYLETVIGIRCRGQAPIYLYPETLEEGEAALARLT